MQKKYDAVIVGANVAGSSIGYHLARNGFRVAMLDIYAGEDIGSHSCGDGLDVHEFKRLGIRMPKGEFIHGDVIRGKVIAPNRESELAAQGKIKAVHRYHFCQYLKDRAVDSGVSLVAPARASAPILKKDSVMGLKYKTLGGGALQSLNTNILIDASGLNACIRRQLPKDWWVTEQVDKKDIAVCYKESRIFRKPLVKKFIHGYFTSEIAPGGFYWLATRTTKLINVGLGINYRYMPLSPKRQLYTKILPRHPILKGSEVVWRGGGLVPRRRPLDCMVGNGFLAIGDAAAMVNPMSGGGIGPGMYAAELGGKIITAALEERDYSIEKLWQYNFQYNTTYGPVQAGNYILRKIIESLSDAQLNALLGAKLFSDKEIINVIESGKLELGYMDKLRKLGKLAKHPKLLLKLRALYKNMETARKIYRNYPADIDGFLKWRNTARKVFNKI